MAPAFQSMGACGLSSKVPVQQPSASAVNPFVMQEKCSCDGDNKQERDGGAACGPVSFQDQLRESLGIFEEVCGEDEDAEMDAGTERADSTKFMEENRSERTA